MTAEQRQEEIRRAAEHSPTAWFAVLERAVSSGDFRQAATAVDRLANLGYRVKFSRPSSRMVTTDERS